ncbi:MAG: hypothetical protein IJA34_00825 [Lachnospiraceae bacterium]|nr:hypothetical protein [Lachnospiraceae bacterium]
MSNEKDKLIELLKDTLHEWECDVQFETISEIADHLLANGVIVPPCKVGDTVYKVSFVYKTVTQLKVEGFIYNLASWKVHCTHLVPSWLGNQKEHIYISFSSFGKNAFLDYKKAEQVLKEYKNNG